VVGFGRGSIVKRIKKTIDGVIVPLKTKQNCFTKDDFAEKLPGKQNKIKNNFVKKRK